MSDLVRKRRTVNDINGGKERAFVAANARTGEALECNAWLTIADHIARWLKDAEPDEGEQQTAFIRIGVRAVEPVRKSREA